MRIGEVLLDEFDRSDLSDDKPAKQQSAGPRYLLRRKMKETLAHTDSAEV